MCCIGRACPLSSVDVGHQSGLGAMFVCNLMRIGGLNGVYGDVWLAGECYMLLKSALMVLGQGINFFLLDTSCLSFFYTRQQIMNDHPCYY